MVLLSLLMMVMMWEAYGKLDLDRAPEFLSLAFEKILYCQVFRHRGAGGVL